MLTKKFLTVLVGLGILVGASVALAQSNTNREKTLFDRLDDFGKSIFGGILPIEKTKKAPSPSTTPNRNAPAKSRSPDSSDDEGGTPRAGSIPSGAGQRPPANKRPARAPLDFGADDAPAAISHRGDVSRVIRRPPVDAPSSDDTNDTASPSPKTYAGLSNKNGNAAPAEQAELPGLSKPVSRPLHERLAGLRQSAFGPDTENDPRTQSNLPSQQAAEGSASAAKSSNNSPAKAPHPARRPLVAERTQVGVGVEPLSDPATRAPAAIDSGAAAAIDTGAPPAPPKAAPAATNDAPVAANPQQGVLFNRQGPVLNVETIGPRTISVGKESSYAVSIVNSGEVAAENLTVFISLPEWTEVASVLASTGAAQSAAANPAAGFIQWKVGRLDAKARQELTIRLIARKSRSFDLAVRWEYKPMASQAMIDVQEPKLSLQLDGPREVLYGKKELYRLRLANTGNGNAENVVITLVPMGTGENVPASHKLALLAAGEEKTLDVELTARQPGNLMIRAEARGDGGLRVESAHKVLVRRPELAVKLDGPKTQFVGTVATYSVRIVNPGNAPARNVNLSLALPTGAKYLSGVEGARIDAAGDKLQWTIESLAAETEQRFAVKCRLGAVGVSRLQLTVTADDDLAARAETPVEVNGVANLTMEVKDPAGPAPIGEETIYEVVVRNRGTKEAQGVEVFGYFSRGIEPTATEGAPSRLASGEVVFQSIASLAPGEEVVLKIHARAEVAGNHIFRAEAHCKPLSARLIREATVLYYGEVAAGKPTAGEPSGEALKAPPHQAMRPIPHPIPHGEPPTAK
jgi:uncharacterized repeat protein (TIGR01451 family)